MVGRKHFVQVLAWFVFAIPIAYASGYASSGVATPVSIANGGTGAATAAANTAFGNFTGSTAAPAFTTAATVRSSMGAAASGANSDITALSGLTGANSIILGSDVVGLNIKGSASQTANIQEWHRGSDNYLVGYVDSGINLYHYNMRTERLNILGDYVALAGAGMGLSFWEGATLLGSGGAASNQATFTGKLIVTDVLTSTLGTKYPPQTAPSAPDTGWIVYTNTADGDLYAKEAGGTTIKLADKP
jgi:hypothetical protein